MGDILEALIEVIGEILIDGMSNASENPKLPKILRYILATVLFILLSFIFLLLLFSFEPDEIPQKVLVYAFGAFCLVLYISLLRNIRKSKN